ncbi:FHA domain-containing protein [Candidatus Micrarchaeota archaeon]|nr:FHA domain-containing protein [Candidatus Micrarchaeota archaeon]
MSLQVAKTNGQASLVFRDLSGSKRRIILDKNTHLGRVPFPEHRSPRELPPVFKKAQIAVLVENDGHISRNHALLVREDEQWVLHDLNSLNGTRVNGESLPRGGERTLRSGDIIKIAHTPLVFSPHEGEIENFALLVGNPGFPPLRGIENDIDSMQDVLSDRKNFPGNVSTLSRDKATREAILNMLESFALIATNESSFVFYYAGHGGITGLSVFDGTLTPKDLYSRLVNIRGKKLVLLDSCHSSVFLDGRSSNTLVISGESPKGHLYEGPVSTMLSDGYYVQGYLTRAFIKLLRGNSGRINLKEIAAELEKYHKLRLHDVGVAVEGSTFSITSAIER